MSTVFRSGRHARRSSARYAHLVLIALFPLALSGCPEGGDAGNTIGSGEAAPPPTAMLQESPYSPTWGHVGAFAGALECAACHKASPGVPDVMFHEGRDVSPYTGWRHSMMANAFADPYFQAKMVSETAVLPHLAGVIEDKCLTCHAPMGRTHALHTGTGLDADGLYRLETALDSMHAREGVSCTLCHQVQPGGDEETPALGTLATFTGGFRIEPGMREIYGPYVNPVSRPMDNSVGYDPVHGEHMRSSAHCATCHTLFTPVVDVDTGEPTGGEFPEQTAYLEWQNSVFFRGDDAKQCQTCHMPVPEDGYGTVISTRNGARPPEGWPEREPFHYHAMVGGNTYMLTLFREFREVLGLLDTTEEGFQGKIDETRDLLENRTAELVIEPAVRDGNVLEIPVRITNRTGHKLPTGYPSRRMWLHVKVFDAGDRVVFESGAADDRGRLSVDTAHTRPACLAAHAHAPDPGVDTHSCYEPHRDVIDSPEQVAIYESVLGDVNGDITYVLLYADRYLKDNRIPPRGYERNHDLGNGLGVAGTGVTGVFGVPPSDTDFSPDHPDGGSGQDVVRYRVPADPATGPFRVEAGLMFQSVRPAFAGSLHGTDDPRVERFRQMYERVPPAPEVLATAEALL